ncbi:HIT domain-containing protein [Herbiconiux sp. CPCC 203406]|uniref:HIT family protein n=1 Tax=Herbiconiux oxytropis TaxID=2970915 RepID=UPI00217E0559|nr:HIT domain-containing protein [Herbiconiux oxytropis]MCS5723480.1 HIT domain-containing protein [Herbiconiux oxytropis]
MDHAVVPPVSDSCAFCDYLSGARPYVFLWRDEDMAVAVTREQRGIAHLIVFPVRHVPSVLDLPGDLAEPMMVAVRDAAIAIDESVKRPGISIWQNNGVSAGQKIDHLHIHVAGTIPGGGTNFDDVPEISIEMARSIARQLVGNVRTTGDAAKRRLFT